MKNILIATDFSENSIDALHVGLELAKKFDSKVYLFHFFALPMSSSEFPEVIDYRAYEKVKMGQLQKIKNKIKQKDVDIELASISGFSFINEIDRFSKKNAIDLIVMGLTGASRMEELFLGSNTISLLLNSTIPTLAIPKGFKLKDKPKIAFAYDGKELKNQARIDLLVDIVKKLNTKISAFHVSKVNHDLEHYEILKKQIPFEFFTLETKEKENVDQGILEYVTNNKVDILALVPRKHNFFDRLFHESQTHEIAHYGFIPILVLPE